MSILDNIYKQAGTVSNELKGMNSALKQMQTNDRKEYKLDAQERKYQKEQSKREKQDQKEFHNKVFDNTGKQVQSIKKQEQGKKLAAGLASATSAAIAKSVKKKRQEKDLDKSGDIGGGTGGPSFSAKDILMSTPIVPMGPPPGNDDHEERIVALEKIIQSEPEREKYTKLQSGGFAGAVPNLGQPGTGDHFYTHVQPGSYVLNRNAVQAMGFQGGGNVPVALEQGEIVIPPGQYDQKMMDFINYAAAPRFQSGGLVKAEHPDTGSGYSVGKDYKGRPSTLSKSAATALQKMISESGGQVKTSDITSAKRSTEKNAAVGGVPNSNHLSGNAMDIHGTSKAWLKENGQKYGWKWLDYSGHDGHFDFVGSSGPPAEGETRADPEVKESKSEETSSQEAAEEAGIPEPNVGSASDLGTLGSIGGGLFAPFFETLNNQIFGGGDNKYGIGLGHILGGVGLGTVAKIGMDSLTQAAGAAEKTIPQMTGSKGSGDRSHSPSGKGVTPISKKATGEWAPLLDLIASVESVKGSYDSIYPSSIKKGLSNMTIAQADAWQARTAGSRGSAAAGRYQFMYIKQQAAAAGLKPSEKFSPENQDKMAVALITGKRGVSKAMIKQNPTEAGKRLAMEWAGLPVLSPTQGAHRRLKAGQSYYSGDGRNSTNLPPSAVKNTFKKLKSGGLVSLKKASMSDDMSKFFVQTDNQLMEQAAGEVAPQIIQMGGESEDNSPAVTMHHSGSNLPTYDLPTRDSCPLSVYYRYHPSLNPQGMNP